MNDMKELCDTLQIPEKKGTRDELAQLKRWCSEHVSQDRVYTTHEGAADEYDYYIDIATHYFRLHKAESPLHDAAEQGFNRFVESTETKAECLNEESADGLTPLHLAAQMGHYHTVLALLSKGANAHQLNRQKQLPLSAALMLPIIRNTHLIANKSKIAEHLLQQASTNELAHRDSSGNTICHLMAIYGFSELLKALLQTHPKLALIHNNAGATPVHAAILNQQTQSLKLLLEVEGAGATLDAKKRTPLHYAVLYGNQETIATCCLQGAELNALDTDGNTPLHLAKEIKNSDAVSLLLRHGALEPHHHRQNSY